MSSADGGVRVSGQTLALPEGVVQPPSRLRSPWFGGAVYLLLFGLSSAFLGVPMTRDQVFLWLLLGMLVFSLSDLRVWLRGIVVDWLPLFGVLFTYDLLRGFADNLAASAHTWPQLRADAWLFGGTVPTVALQRQFFASSTFPLWYDYAAWFIYMSHFFAALGTAAVLWKVAYPKFRQFIAMFLGVTLAAFATYVLFPAVPPWLASANGDLEPTVRIIKSMWYHLGVDSAVAVFSGGNRFANDVAAVPSLHAAYPALMTLFFWHASSRWVRGLLIGYCILMGATLVYGSEHYVVDILLGWMYAGVVFAIARAIIRRRLPASPVVQPLARVR